MKKENKCENEDSLTKILEDAEYFLAICDFDFYQNFDIEKIKKLKSHESISEFIENSKKIA